MPLQLETNEYQDYVQCVVSGAHETHLDFNLPVQEVLQHCRNSDCIHALIDYRLVASYPEPTYKLELLSDFATIYNSYINFGGSPVRFAFVVRAEADDNNEILLNVANDMTIADDLKLDLILTTDIDKAIAWLKDAKVPPEQAAESQEEAEQ